MAPRSDPSAPYSRYRTNPGKVATVTLPAEGCEDPAPPLPAGRGWADHEATLWAAIWSAPQADQYDESFIPAIAAYIVLYGKVLDGSAAAYHTVEFRQLGDRLGLSPQGLQSLGWRIGGDR